MYNCTIFKGFKRTGNHIIIFNMIDNILNNTEENNELNNIGTWLFYNHEKKLIYFNCIDAHFDLYRNLIWANITNDSSLKTTLIDILYKFFCDKDVTKEQIIKFIETPITSEYNIFLSIEDTVFVKEDDILHDIFGKDSYKFNTFYIIRDIDSLYASRKKTGWMPANYEFIDSYINYFNTYEVHNNFIIFNKYLTDYEYRKNIHNKALINNYRIFETSRELPIGNSSFEDKTNVLDRSYLLDDIDMELLSRSELNEIKIKIKAI